MQTITFKTKLGHVIGGPVTTWEALVSHWQRIAKAFFEVLIENDFSPYTATFSRPNGFVADRHHWQESIEDQDTFPLREARRFPSKLVKHKDFWEAIRSFNAKGGE